MLSPGADGWADVDYFFAQVNPLEREVDFRPTCGNILAGVGPAAIEMGLVAPDGPVTRVRIRAVNTGARVEALVETPGGYVDYDGDTAIDGVPGTAAPIRLDFLDTAGSVCDGMLPTGQASDSIEGVAVTCIDVAMPLMIARAQDFGVTGYETREELDADAELLARMERVRREGRTTHGAGRRHALGHPQSCVARAATGCGRGRDGPIFHALAMPSLDGGHGGAMHRRLPVPARLRGRGHRRAAGRESGLRAHRAPRQANSP